MWKKRSIAAVAAAMVLAGCGSSGNVVRVSASKRKYCFFTLGFSFLQVILQFSPFITGYVRVQQVFALYPKRKVVLLQKRV